MNEKGRPPTVHHTTERFTLQKQDYVILFSSESAAEYTEKEKK
jgi:hypothetical protein